MSDIVLLIIIRFLRLRLLRIDIIIILSKTSSDFVLDGSPYVSVLELTMGTGTVRLAASISLRIIIPMLFLTHSCSVLHEHVITIQCAV